MGTYRTIGSSTRERPARRRRDRGIRRAELAVFVVVALALAAASCLPTPADGAQAATSVRAVRVESSDTLWGIAQESALAGESTEQAVRRIRELNGLDASDQLQAGTFVLVPRLDPGETALAKR